MSGDPDKRNLDADDEDDGLDDHDAGGDGQPGLEQGTPQKAMSLFLMILLIVVGVGVALVPLVILYTIAAATWRAQNY